MEKAGFHRVEQTVPEGSNYEITGPDCQILTINLNPGERVEAEPGSMMFMSPRIKSSVEMGRCSRLCVGETLCKAVYQNPMQQPEYVALTPNFPAKVVPIDLSKTGKMIAKKGAYMSGIGDVAITLDLDCSCRACCSGLGCYRTGASGTGTVFFAAGGTILMKTLAEGETIVVDETSLVGYQESATLGIRVSGGCCTCCCAGEGLFLTTITGPGMVILQSMSFEKYKAAVAPPVQGGAGGGDAGGGGGGGE